MQTQRLDQLTITRFLAILVVLIFHGGGGVYFDALKNTPLSYLFVSATTSVTYLYVLSGFVMALAHYRPDEKFSFENYWKARVVRLYPLYLLGFLLICYYYLDSIAYIKLPKTLANVFVLQAWIPDYSQSYNFPAWSITVEFFFYAIFPLFAFWAARLSTKKIIWFSLALWAFTQIIHAFLWQKYFPEHYKFLVFFPLFHLSTFILGAAAGIWFLRTAPQRVINPRVNFLFLALGILLASAFVIYIGDLVYLPQGDQLMTGWLAPLMTLIILVLALDTTRFSIFLKHPTLILLGEISYAIYILHIPIRWLYELALEKISAQNIFAFSYLPLMILLGYLAHFYIDLPIRKWLTQTLKRISLPLFVLDLAVLSLSIYLSFRLRFDTPREFDSYYPVLLLAFWSALLARTVFSTLFNAFDLSISFTRPVLFSVTASTIVITAISFIGYTLNWFENFPRSVFVIDWFITLALSLFVRYMLKSSFGKHLLKS